MEYVPHGTCYDFIRDPELEYTWEMKVKIASDIANGMAYLHSMAPRYVHRDLKTPNILVPTPDVIYLYF
jgi:serine/threonine protein kinase